MNQPKGSKKRFTVTATKEGIEKAEKALMRLGFESQINFAEAILISRTTVSKFFNHKPINLDSFKRICEKLGDLRWQEIAGISENKQKEIITVKNFEPSSKKEIISATTFQREVTIIDPQTKTKKTVITLQGDIESVTNIKILQSILQEHSGNTIEIQDIQPGSIKISLEGSQEDIDNLIAAIKSKELTQLDSFLIEDIVEVDEKIETTETNDKWQLVQKIRDQKVKKLDFREIDLSNADLSNADLRGADLRGADLRGADLSNADLSNADLSNADLGGADLIRADLIRADLSNADLSNADLSNADLIRANLRGANLSNADLGGADLIRADLSNADLIRADLSNADLSNANLSNANLKSIINNEQFDQIVTAILSGKYSWACLLILRFAGYNPLHYLPYRTYKRLMKDNSRKEKNRVHLRDTDLRDANVKNAHFGYNSGVSESFKKDLIARGAIFEDSPRDSSGIPTPA